MNKEMKQEKIMNEDQDEIKRLSEQIMSEKMLNLYKEKISTKIREVSYQDFIKEMYGE